MKKCIPRNVHYRKSDNDFEENMGWRVTILMVTSNFNGSELTGPCNTRRLIGRTSQPSGVYHVARVELP